jgi:hypothetical protein
MWGCFWIAVAFISLPFGPLAWLTVALAWWLLPWEGEKP